MKQIQLVKYSALVMAAWLSGCSPKVDNRGYVSSGGWKSQIKVGQTTRDDVQMTFGSPSSKSSFGTETWYYMSARKETTAFLKPEVVEQDVLRIEFDSAGIVSKAEAFDETSGQDVSVAKRTTPTEGHQLGFIEQLLGNIGRFNKGSDDSAAPGRRQGN